MAFSLWCFDIGRIHDVGTVLLPWELIVLGLLARYSKKMDLTRSKGSLALLGFWTGLGYLAFPNWPFVASLIVLTLCWSVFPNPLDSFKVLFRFSAFFLLAFSPLLVALCHQDYSLIGRLRSALPTHLSMEDHFLNTFSYFSVLFWGPLKGIVVGFTENFEDSIRFWVRPFLLV